MRRILIATLVLGAMGFLAVVGSGDPEPETNAAPGSQIARAVAFVEGLAGHDSAAVTTAMDATMSAALPPAAQASLWSAVTDQNGAFVAIGATTTGQISGYDVVYVRCDFQHGSLFVKVVFDKAEKVTGLFLLPDVAPVDLAPGVIERGVTFEGAGGIRIAGTLTMPASVAGRAVPALVLIGGSGPVDRDGNSGPEFQTNLLRQLAACLADAGVATIRYDKRGIGESAAKVTDLADFCAWGNYVHDAIAALAFVRQQAGIDPHRVGFAGHSEGGIIAVDAASRLAGSPDHPSVLILLSTPGRPTLEVLHDQIARLGRPDLLAKSDAICAQIRDTGVVPADLPTELAPLYPSYAGKLLEPEFKLNTSALAHQYRGPILVIQGGGDIQVPPDKDGPRLDAALKTRLGDVHQYYLSPQTSHNLKAVTNPDDPGTSGPIVPGIVDVLKKWVEKEMVNN